MKSTEKELARRIFWYCLHIARIVARVRQLRRWPTVWSLESIRAVGFVPGSTSPNVIIVPNR